MRTKKPLSKKNAQKMDKALSAFYAPLPEKRERRPEVQFELFEQNPK